MKITGLCGKSGTGKSYKAGDLAASIGADGIIDDGLFIYDGQIIEGISAKAQKTKIGAIKTAVFIKDDHALLVSKAIQSKNPKHILILGTSDKMILTIAERLELPIPDEKEIIHIEDISSEKEMEIASNSRHKLGMHTIPAPTLQVKNRFSGFLIDPKRAFRKQENKTKTVIRPTYSYLGNYELNERIISQIVNHVAQITPGCSGVILSASDNTSEGIYIRVIINVERGYKLFEVCELLQKRIAQAVNHTTSFAVLGVEIEVRGYTKSNRLRY